MRRLLAVYLMSLSASCACESRPEPPAPALPREVSFDTVPPAAKASVVPAPSRSAQTAPATSQEDKVVSIKRLESALEGNDKWWETRTEEEAIDHGERSGDCLQMPPTNQRPRPELAPDALAGMVFTPPLHDDRRRTLSLHRRPSGEHFTRVEHASGFSDTPPRYERTLPSDMARTLQRLWSELLSPRRRLPLPSSSLDFTYETIDPLTAVELVQGVEWAWSESPKGGSVSAIAADTAKALARLTERPYPGDERELPELQRRLEKALTRALEKRPCWLPRR